MKIGSIAVASLGALAVFVAGPSSAQTLTESLASAYSTNPELNAARSQLRAVDEGIPLARSGNRPTVEAVFEHTNRTTRNLGGGPGLRGTSGDRPTAISLRLTQPLFQGFQVRNRVRGAESAVLAQRASLQNTEQNILLDVATAFEDVIQNRSIVELRRSDVRFLSEQVRAAEDRFEVGEGTRTDVSQSEARRAQAQSALNFAEANVAAAEARYQRLTGLEPGRLSDNFDVQSMLPASLEEAIAIGQNSHPAIIAALHDVDVAVFNVKELEGQFLPSVSVQGSAGTTFDPGNRIDRQDSAAVRLNVTVPIYQSGRVSAQVRQAKEQLGTSRIQVDLTRDQVRQNTIAAWASYRASLRSIQSARTGVFAAQLALQGIVEERRVGQRTTLDVLDSQRDLIQAQVTLVQAERDADVDAFALLSAIGRLSVSRLGLQVAIYDPVEHTDAVRGKWFGANTPDGR